MNNSWGVLIPNYKQFETDIDGLVQNCSISMANALEILQLCTKPSLFIILPRKRQIYLQIIFAYEYCCILVELISDACTCVLRPLPITFPFRFGDFHLILLPFSCLLGISLVYCHHADIKSEFPYLNPRNTIGANRRTCQDIIVQK